MDESDLRVRLAAFTFLDERRKVSPELFDRRELQRGFRLDGERARFRRRTDGPMLIHGLQGFHKTTSASLHGRSFGQTRTSWKFVTSSSSRHAEHPNGRR